MFFRKDMKLAKTKRHFVGSCKVNIANNLQHAEGHCKDKSKHHRRAEASSRSKDPLLHVEEGTNKTTKMLALFGPFFDT